MSSKQIADFFDRECCTTAPAADEPDDEPDDVVTALIRAVERSGIEGSTVLELGAGDGALSRQLLRRGASVTGVDLSPESVRYATGRAAAEGLGARAVYRIGDAADTALEQHDVVLSNRVFCCYPEPTRLLANTLPAARRLYLLALPESRGVIGIGSRLVVMLANAWQWLRRDRFRAYVHDVRLLERLIGQAGWTRVSSERHGGWVVLAYGPDAQAA